MATLNEVGSSLTDATGEDARKPPEGVSAFVARVLDQLSLSAWLPSAVLVAGGAALGSLRLSGGSLDGAIRQLAKLEFPDLVMLSGLVVILTTLTEAYEFGSIRLLEGYWGIVARRTPVSAAFVRLQHWSTQRANRRYRSLRIEAYALVRSRFADEVGDDAIVAVVDAEVHERPNSVRLSPEQQETLMERDWTLLVPPESLHRIDEWERHLRMRPDEHRTLPTRLGNILRHFEDRANEVVGGDVRGMVQRSYHQLPRHIQQEIDQNKVRLGLHSTLVVTALLLAVGALIFVAPVSLAAGLWSAAVAGGMALAFRQAALRSAELYGGLLVEMADFVGTQRELSRDVDGPRWGYV